MGGIDWPALPVVVELLGIIDVDGYINQLLTIRDFQTSQRDP